MKALVVGDGPWAQFLFQRISQEPDIEANTVPARKLIEVFSSRASYEDHWDLVLCVTRPSLQEYLVPILAKYSKYLWLEKPIAESSKGCDAILESLNKYKSAAMVNLPWNYSQIWRKFESIRPNKSKVSKIEISRRGVVGQRNYISIIEDYGTHDLCLFFDWIGSPFEHKKVLSYGENRDSTFRGLIHEINISWNWEKSINKKEMKWRIFDKDGNIFDLDFYNSTIHVNEKLVEVEKSSSDNISRFLKSLITDNDEVHKKNIAIAIATKQLFIESFA